MMKIVMELRTGSPSSMGSSSDSFNGANDG
jgi:hypothetical protein